MTYLGIETVSLSPNLNLLEQKLPKLESLDLFEKSSSKKKGFFRNFTWRWCLKLIFFSQFAAKCLPAHATKAPIHPQRG